ncbi:hypothetical protein FQR65_LT05474 [Abscondita terminalis]|nr:hypothetical protein FQR65_LT05474 [Abscondita terminalis]
MICNQDISQTTSLETHFIDIDTAEQPDGESPDSPTLGKGKTKLLLRIELELFKKLTFNKSSNESKIWYHQNHWNLTNENALHDESLSNPDDPEGVRLIFSSGLQDKELQRTDISHGAKIVSISDIRKHIAGRKFRSLFEKEMDHNRFDYRDGP